MIFKVQKDKRKSLEEKEKTNELNQEKKKLVLN
jgi:hypothetical protein